MKNGEKIGNVDDAILAADKVLENWEKSAANSHDAAAASLLRALNPHWCRWIKEAGFQSEDVIHAVAFFCSTMIGETVSNVAKPDESSRSQLGIIMLKLVAERAIYNITHAEECEPLPGFRRKDS